MFAKLKCQPLCIFFGSFAAKTTDFMMKSASGITRRASNLASAVRRPVYIIGIRSGGNIGNTNDR